MTVRGSVTAILPVRRSSSAVDVSTPASLASARAGAAVATMPAASSTAPAGAATGRRRDGRVGWLTVLQGACLSGTSARDRPPDRGTPYGPRAGSLVGVPAHG